MAAGMEGPDNSVTRDLLGCLQVDLGCCMCGELSNTLQARSSCLSIQDNICCCEKLVLASGIGKGVRNVSPLPLQSSVKRLTDISV